MLRYHLFRIAALWIPEYGSPDDPEAFRWLSAYSPYHHVRDGVALPGGASCTPRRRDTRVDPMHARKMTARLQAATASGSRPVLLRVESKAGHGAGKPLAQGDRPADRRVELPVLAAGNVQRRKDAMKKTRVIILFGGRSAEHEISILSARNVLGRARSRRASSRC